MRGLEHCQLHPSETVGASSFPRVLSPGGFSPGVLMPWAGTQPERLAGAPGQPAVRSWLKVIPSFPHSIVCPPSKALTELHGPQLLGGGLVQENCKRGVLLFSVTKMSSPEACLGVFH